MSEWISVEDRLPKIDSKDVLFYDPGFGVKIGCYCGLRYDEHEWRDNSSYTNVTHWMPLPEPPEDK